MTTFVIVTEQDNNELFQRVKSVYPNDSSIKINKTLILIHSETETFAKQVNGKIEGKDLQEYPLKKFGRSVTFSISSYNGWHLKTMWEWLKEKGV